MPNVGTQLTSQTSLQGEHSLYESSNSCGRHNLLNNPHAVMILMMAHYFKEFDCNVETLTILKFMSDASFGPIAYTRPTYQMLRFPTSPTLCARNISDFTLGPSLHRKCCTPQCPSSWSCGAPDLGRSLGTTFPPQISIPSI